MEHAMPAPAVCLLMCRRQEFLADVAEEVVADLQGQPLSCGAISLGAERAVVKVTNFGAGNIAVQNLLQEQGDGGGRVELAMAPVIIVFAADPLDGAAIQNRQGIALDEMQGMGDTCHPWPPVGR